MKVDQSQKLVASGEVLNLASEIITNNMTHFRCEAVTREPKLLEALRAIREIENSSDGEPADKASKIMVIGSKCLADHSDAITPEFVYILSSMAEAAAWLNPGAVREYCAMKREAAVKLIDLPDLNAEHRANLKAIIAAANSELSGSTEAGYKKYQSASAV